MLFLRHTTVKERLMFLTYRHSLNEVLDIVVLLCIGFPQESLLLDQLGCVHTRIAED